MQLLYSYEAQDNKIFTVLDEHHIICYTKRVANMTNFIKSQNKNNQKLVLFQTGNYQYEIWNHTTKKTVRALWDTSYEDAIKFFNQLT